MQIDMSVFLCGMPQQQHVCPTSLEAVFFFLHCLTRDVNTIAGSRTEGHGAEVLSPLHHKLDKPNVTYTIPCRHNLCVCVCVFVYVCVGPWTLREMMTDL